MLFERLRKQRLPLFFAIPAGALALTACGPNYSGDGNEFVVQGKVTNPGKHSLKARIFEVDAADGEADGWFKEGTVHQLHDNCACHGFWDSNKKYGVVYDFNGYEKSPSEVAVGACVRFEGRIRSDASDKEDRPVYDVAQEENCENLGQ